MRGFEALDEHLDRGEPVIIVVWHERLFFSTYFFDTTKGRVCAITTNSRMATLGHLMLRKFDFAALMIPPKSQTMQFNRQILKHLKNGGSIVISPDGTRGPAREAKNFPILWARTAKVPVYMASFSVRRYFCLPTWDRSQIALPFNKGAMLIQRWESEAATSRTSASQVDELCLDLTKAMNDVTDATDALVEQS